ncbi:MAG: amino acid adenylation domain-containing protein, partial [Candidatus Parabeggiatoa sp.]|nr:amino acid adenylation domain-containing protein [Candidatus Parabeggiatoa sp.]
TDYPKDQSIVELFEQQVVQNPSNLAVVFEGEELSYQELNEKSNQLAHHLQQIGVLPQSLVGLCVKRSADMVIGLLGILKTGAAYLPIDPDYPNARIAFMLKDAQASVILTHSSLTEKLPSTLNRLCLDTETFEQPSSPLARPTLSSEALAYVCYTSGSTGTPKGVCVRHQSVIRLVKNTAYVRLNPADRVAQASNIAFDAATFEIWGALLNGARLIGVPKEIALSPSEFMQHLQQTGINTLFLTTALFNQMARYAADGFATLKQLLFGGELVDPQSVAKVLAAGPPQRLLHVYGPTENTTFSTWYPIDWVAQDATTIPIGQPLSNDRVYILDRQHQLVPCNVPGELCLAGDGLAQGYLNRPELTGKKFVEVVLFGKRERIYKTGDLARWLPDGAIEYISRLDHQVKLRGFRIELGEIEAALSHHALVKEAVLILSESIHTHDKRLIAYVVPQQESQMPEFEQVVQQSSEAFIKKWQELYDDIVYKEADDDLAFNLSGWQSSYTGEPIPAQEMQVWVEGTVEAIRALKPKAVLEIGCGTGLLLSRLAPHTITYWGTDFSEVVLQQVEQLKQRQAELAHLVLKARTADDFSGIEAGQFDTVVLNSVVQYF